MSKELFLKQFAKAKQSHSTQMNQLKLLVRNMPLDDIEIYVGMKETGLGKWFYDDTIPLKSLIHDSIYNDIDNFLNEWQDVYFKIYQIYYPEKPQGLISKFLKKRHKVSELDQDKAQFYFKEIEEISLSLRRSLNSIEGRLNTLPEKSYNF